MLYTTIIGAKITDLYISPLSYPQIAIALNNPYSISEWIRLVTKLPDWEVRSGVDWVAVLNNWIEEMPKPFIAQVHKVAIGDLGVATQLAEWLIYSAKVIAIVKRNSKGYYLEGLQHRMKYGIKDDISELCRVKYIGRERARQLYKAGIKTTVDLKNKKGIARYILKGYADRVFKGLE